MKIFYCSPSECYSGGIIAVAANSVDEAFNIAAQDANLDCYFYAVDKNDNYIRRDENFDHYESDSFPKEAWKELEHVEYKGSEPKVIINDFYIE